MVNIKNVLLNQNFKAVLNYCFRVLIFLLLSRDFIFQYTAEFMLPIIGGLIGRLELEPFADAGIFAVICLIMHDYLSAKICGLFKKIDKMNIFFAAAIIMAIDIVRGYTKELNIQLYPPAIVFEQSDFIFGLIFSFLIYRFLNFLTKIFPVPFKQIRYLFSIEFIKDIYKNFKPRQ